MYIFPAGGRRMLAWGAVTAAVAPGFPLHDGREA